jgi:lipoate-protein ligase A
MYFLESPSNNPAFNIALEEYLLRETEHEYFLLYVDEPSVIVGKHQNALAEINYKFVVENKIPVIRRISGGGTVFHDLGNLNFCFIANSREGHQIDFKKYTRPIIEVLRNDFDIPAELGGKNDIKVHDLKVSGNAEHVFKNRVLHHGTLLVNSELQNLSQALKVVPGRYIDKAVKSIRSKVANLNQFNNQISLELLKEKLKNKIVSEVNVQECFLKENEIAIIQYKVEEKFDTWEWNFGYSPAYKFVSEQIQFDVENGFIIHINENKFPQPINLVGNRHRYFDLKKTGLNPWEFF